MNRTRKMTAVPGSSGFTLIEILIVITIAGLVSAITLAGIGSIGASNRRTTCQTNMTQIYQALRLYNADFGTFPPYQPDPAVSGIPGRGLFSLYCSDTSPDSPSLEVYLKRPAALHCPEDTSQADNFFVASGTFNMNYISYQQRDDLVVAGDPSPSLYPSYTYQPTRTTDTTLTTIWPRQLIPWDNGVTSHVPLPRPPADDTVVTWCFHHRASSGGRNYDNVLFYDGSVQLIQRLQDDPGGSAAVYEAWQRVSRKVF